MEFIGLKVVGALIIFGAGFLFGKNWYRLNSVDDITSAFAAAKTKFEGLKTKAEEQIKADEAKIAKAKELLNQ